MSNKFKNFFSPNDIIPILIIITGIMMAVFIGSSVVRLIGIGVSILGVIALFMLISQRKSDIVEPKYKSHAPNPNFNITRKEDSTAKRQTFEDYKKSIDDEDKIEIKEEDYSKSNISKDEGFRVVGKKTVMSEEHISNTKMKYANKEIPKEKENQIIENIKEKPEDTTKGYEDDSSGFKVVGTTNTKNENADIKESSSSNVGNAVKTNPEKLEKIVEKIGNSRDKSDNQSKENQTTEEEIDEKSSEDITLEESEPKPEIKFLRNDKIKIPLEALMDTNLPEGGSPKKEFEYYLNRILNAICSVSNTKTATFMMVNHQTQELVLESSFSEAKNIYPLGSRFPLDNDIISQIVKNNTPEILSEINPSAELELIPYYTQSQSTLSFIGIPVFMDDSVIGVITGDSSIHDAYDSTTVGFISHFTKMISALLKAYIEKFDLVNASKTLNVIENFRINSNEDEFSYRSIYKSILNTVSNMIDCSAVGICGFDEQKGDWFIVSEVLTDDNSVSQLDSHIDSSTLIGKTLLEGKPVHMTEFNNNLIRVSSKEKDKKEGFFLSIPMVTHTTTYGALYIEGDESGFLTQNDIDIISVLAEHAALSIEKLHFMEMLQSSALIDNDSGLLNTKAFYSRLDEEQNRSKDTGENFCLAIMKIDKYSSIDPEKYQQRMQSVLVNVIEIINKNKKKYDVFGSLDGDVFSVILLGMNSESAKIWCERIRNEIAISVLEVDSKKFNVTVSIGLADNNSAKNIDELMNNCTTAINHSLENTNTVTLYN